MRVLCIDNYDSFTFNLVHALEDLEVDVLVARNDAISAERAHELAARGDVRGVVISPGPSTPDEAGVTLDVIARAAGVVPILGVCLGHQAIGRAFGARVTRSAEIVHGKATPVHHRGRGVFHGLPSPLACGRYHSLVIDRVPNELEVTCWSERGEVMGVRHRALDVEGVQFHPESILTERGAELIGAWVERCQRGAS